MSLEIRKAVPGDEDVIHDLILGIADYENLSHEVEATREDLTEALFSDASVAHCFLAYWDGQIAGFALYFYNFSTFVGKKGIYLEDLFVKPEFRKKGIGKALLLHLSKEAKLQGCGRMEWTALDWNTPAHDFYKSLGANLMNEWKHFRVTKTGIAKMAEL